MAKKTLTQATYAVNNIRLLPDQVQDQPTALKTSFDQTGDDNKEFINTINIPELQSETLNASGAHAIGLGLAEWPSSNNVGDALVAVKTAIDDVVAAGIVDGSVTDVKLSNIPGQIKERVSDNTTDISTNTGNIGTNASNIGSLVSGTTPAGDSNKLGGLLPSVFAQVNVANTFVAGFQAFQGTDLFFQFKNVGGSNVGFLQHLEASGYKFFNNATGGDYRLEGATSTVTIYHEGNDGNLAKKDEVNIFTQPQFVQTVNPFYAFKNAVGTTLGFIQITDTGDVNLSTTDAGGVLYFDKGGSFERVSLDKGWKAVTLTTGGWVATTTAGASYKWTVSDGDLDVGDVVDFEVGYGTFQNDILEAENAGMYNSIFSGSVNNVIFLTDSIPATDIRVKYRINK